MKLPRLLEHSFIKIPLLSLLNGLKFLQDLKSIFRKIPQHSNDEANAIRGLASIHPLLPRGVAQFRAILHGHKMASNPDSDIASFLFSEKEMQRCVASLKKNGVYAFEEMVPESLVKDIQKKLRELPAYLRTKNGNEVLFQPSIDESGLFDIRENDLMEAPVLQEYVTNPTWHTIAARYFESRPVHDETVAWWTFPQPTEFASLNAQMFHSDRRRLSFVKFFMYLTDVTTKNGPHMVVPGSHRERRFSLRRDRRYEDAEIFAGCRNKPLEILGKAGTVIAVDTQALHKGKMIEAEHRLILELQFSTDLLGPPSMELHNEWCDVAKARLVANPDVFQRFHIQSQR